MAEKESPPPIAIGHVTLRVSDVESAVKFYRVLGLRPVSDRPGMAILELRGGTHLMLFRAKAKPTPGPVRSFDFMVEDIETAHAALKDAGIAGTEIRPDQISGHRWFEVTDPDGHALRIFSSHTAGRPV